jgi:hypothetical protein
MKKTQKITFTPARKCFLGYTVLKRYVLETQVRDKKIVLFIATIV